MDGVGEVAPGVRSRCLEQCRKVRMARATVTRHAGKLGLGNAGLSALDGPVVRH